MAESKVEKQIAKEEKILTDKLRENPWIVSSIVLGVFALVLLVFLAKGGIGISEKKMGENAVNFINTQLLQGQGAVTLDSVSSKNGLYEVIVIFQGQKIPTYFTKDGKYFAGTQMVALADNSASENQDSETPADVPKSDKPKVELFVMSYCPYGTQAEKGILPVVALLGDKIDFKLRFVHYTLHGDKEDLENKREMCIREEQGENVLNKYLVCILNSTDPYNPKDPSACEKTAGVNSAKLQTCLKDNAEDYFAADSELSQGYGVQGSPTLIINGVQSSAGRSPQSYLSGICAAFNTAPSECSEKLSSSSPSAGFGYNQGTDTVAQCG